jgi:hypothetical protein
MRKIIAGTAVAAATALGVAGTAIPASASARIYGAGGCSARGDYATCVASGTAYRPKGIEVRTYATPNQKVDVDWTMICAQGSGAGSSSGDFSGRTTLVRRLHQPYRQPANCTIAAEAQLDNGGRYVRVQIIYWR